MSQPHANQRQVAILMLLLANLMWGLSFPVIKTVTLLHAKLLPEASTWFSAIYTVAPRFALAVLVLAVWHGRKLLRTSRLEWEQGVTMGCFAAAGMLLQNDALQFTAASTSAFLTQLYAVLIPVWVAFHRRRNPGPRVWIACVLVLAGVAILGRFDWQEMRFGRGEWETLLCSLFFMGQILWLERPKYSVNDPARLTFVIFATEAVIFAALALVTMPHAQALVIPFSSPTWVGLTLALTFLCTIAAFSLMNTWQPKITATEAGLIYCVEPIFSSLMALFLPALFSVWGGIAYANETVTWTLLVGGALITVANLVVQLNPPPKPVPIP
ncbi:DMT family transporter [Opitutus sp. ER46]|uniref:DMT family transporter n=1 Tax=Opitutus sp. ER46 TaxID=2161864 RepID=UPI000D30151C|nr:DMT family transporter [Opitutus sp. ER46]PTY01158.1 hypothetical protein DB354_00505 [Opitutus sp. ER46]